MMLKRRQLLQLASLSCAVGPFKCLFAQLPDTRFLRMVLVRGDHALPVFAAGDLLLTDTRETHYSGDGVYLYPHWGQPRPYQISLIVDSGAQLLEFRNPGSQQLLWTQSFALDSQFAGKLNNHFSAPYVVSKTGNYPLLSLPVLPSGTGQPALVGNILEKV